MSDAIRNAFYSELRILAQQRYNKTLSDEEITDKYKFCVVHFKRSFLHVKKIQAVVHPNNVDRFEELVVSLFKTLSFEKFKYIVIHLIKEFPNCENWIKWYLQHDRAIILFLSIESYAFLVSR